MNKNMVALVKSLLLVFLVIFQTTYLVIGENGQSIETSIYDYIRRETWMMPGGTLRIPLLGEAGTLNPLLRTTSIEGLIIDCIYDTLVVMTPDMKFAGRLAKRWEVDESGKNWVFYLYENITWHDGKELTAQDVAFTYNLLAEQGLMTPWASVATLIERAEVLDKYVVKITLKAPFAAFLYKVASNIYVLPRHIWENVSDITQFNNPSPVGSGPFIFVEHEPQRYYKLKANEKYHLGRPLIDEILFIIMSDPEAMLLAFSKGDVDAITWSIPYASIKSIENVPSAKIHRAVEVGAHFAFLNCKRYPINETTFRKALYHLINVSEIVEAVFLGYALPGALGFIPPHVAPWHNPNLPPKEEKYPFNPETARRLLDEIGIMDLNNDGWREIPGEGDLRLTVYSYTGDPSLIRIAEMLVNNLKNIGIKAEHRSLELTTLLNNLITGDFDVVIILGGDIEPDILYDFVHSNGGFNFGKCSFPDLDVLLENQRYEMNIDKRREILWEIQEKIAEYIPLLVIAHQEFVFAYRTDNFDGWIVGPVLRPDNYFSFMNIYGVKLVKTSPTPISSPSSTPVTTTRPMEIYPLIIIGVVVVVLAILATLILSKSRKR